MSSKIFCDCISKYISRVYAYISSFIVVSVSVRKKKRWFFSMNSSVSLSLDSVECRGESSRVGDCDSVRFPVSQLQWSSTQPEPHTIVNGWRWSPTQTQIFIQWFWFYTGTHRLTSPDRYDDEENVFFLLNILNEITFLETKKNEIWLFFPTPRVLEKYRRQCRMNRDRLIAKM